MTVELLHLDGFMQCLMSAVNWEFSDWMSWFKFFLNDSYLFNPELDSFDTRNVVRCWSQLLSSYFLELHPFDKFLSLFLCKP